MTPSRTDAGPTLRAEVIHDLAAVEAAEWDACAGGDPFGSHAFLSLLEESGSIGPATGFHPHHLALKGPDGRLLAAVPMYMKQTSADEFLKDANWAAAYESGGGRYYPKLAIGVPLVPVTGARLMLRPDAPPGLSTPLLELIRDLVRRRGLSSAHVFFAGGEDSRHLEAAGWLPRLDVQYHWENRGYADFGDFLASLRPEKASKIRRERRKLTDSGVRLHRLTGRAIREGHWDAFHRMYARTSAEKGSPALLTPDFFHRLSERLGDRVMLVLAEDGGAWIAGSLNIVAGDRLCVRNWGALEDRPLLPFEAITHQAVEYALERGLRVVEGGAGGGYKRERGFDPVLTRSFHWFPDESFRTMIAATLAQERAMVSRWYEQERARTPFRAAAGAQ